MNPDDKKNYRKWLKRNHKGLTFSCGRGKGVQWPNDLVTHFTWWKKGRKGSEPSVNWNSISTAHGGPSTASKKRKADTISSTQGVSKSAKRTQSLKMEKKLTSKVTVTDTHSTKRPDGTEESKSRSISREQTYSESLTYTNTVEECTTNYIKNEIAAVNKRIATLPVRFSSVNEMLEELHDTLQAPLKTTLPADQPLSAVLPTARKEWAAQHLPGIKEKLAEYEEIQQQEKQKKIEKEYNRKLKDYYNEEKEWHHTEQCASHSPPPTLESTCDCEKKCVTTLVPLHVYSPSLKELRQSAHKALEDNPDFKNYPEGFQQHLINKAEKRYAHDVKRHYTEDKEWEHTAQCSYVTAFLQLPEKVRCDCEKKCVVTLVPKSSSAPSLKELQESAERYASKGDRLSQGRGKLIFNLNGVVEYTKVQYPLDAFAEAFGTIHFLERAILLGRIPPETSQWKLKYVAREIIRDQRYNRMGSMLWLKGSWNQKGSIFSKISMCRAQMDPRYLQRPDGDWATVWELYAVKLEDGSLTQFWLPAYFWKAIFPHAYKAGDPEMLERELRASLRVGDPAIDPEAGLCRVGVQLETGAWFRLPRHLEQRPEFAPIIALSQKYQQEDDDDE